MTPRDAAAARSILALILSFGLAFTAVGEAKGSRSRATSSPRSWTRKAPATKTAAAPKTTRSRASQHVTAGRTVAGRIKRSPAAKHAFEVQTGYPHGRSGYVVDHIRPLACGGADAPSNMQWQTIAAAKAKDKIERAGCR
jgi:hypothetical protein